MIFQKGDKVAFINEPLKGVVIEQINETHVLIDCDGMEMDIHKSELIIISHIPKVEGKHIFPVKKANKQIDELPDLKKKPVNYDILKVGDQVIFMSDNSKGVIRSVLGNDEYEVEIEKDFCIPVNRMEIERIHLKKIPLDKAKIEEQIKKDTRKSKPKQSKSHIVSEKYFAHHELDLHIENLIDTWHGLSNFEIVSIQLNHFQKRLFEALKNNEPYFVVIHGVGKGVLKDEIYKFLLQFPNVSMGPANTRKYGMGASEIRID